MDHREGPQTWLAERDAEGNSLEPENGSPDGGTPAADSTAPDIPASADPAPGRNGAASSLRDDALGYGSATGAASKPADDPWTNSNGRFGSAGRQAEPGATTQIPRTYAAAAPDAPAAPGEPQSTMARITAPFSALTRNRKAAKEAAYQRASYQQPAYQQRDYQQNGGPQRPAPAAAAAAAAVPQSAGTTRRAQLVLSRIEPWSVMKFSFMISLVGWVVLFVAVAALYYMLSKLGVFHSIESTVSQVTSSKNSAGTNASSWFSASRVLGYTMLVGAINVVVITALATVGSVIYNLVTHLAGGIEVTLRETD